MNERVPYKQIVSCSHGKGIVSSRSNKYCFVLEITLFNCKLPIKMPHQFFQKGRFLTRLFDREGTVQRSVPFFKSWVSFGLRAFLKILKSIYFPYRPLYDTLCGII